eukprot:TRINITY_DN518_c0_g1_i2.p1 TRINITY_DN518_c0_g1~~TRINITY_DN518_c0_g1_i2.p1  ORF type:complete len:394 (-),score=121.90 TRINITY_DN518_c0_g1_i2:19-1200(-)
MSDACPLPWNKTGKDALRTSLRDLKHPFIQLCTDSDILFDDKQIVTLTLFCNKGSLKDEIYSCEPTNDWEKKYNPKNARKLSTGTIAKYGRQILEALLFLQKSGFPYTHLHTGNVIVKNGTARISQLENGLLNLERQHERLFRQFYKQLPNKFAENDLNVISFGTVLYEMAVGKVLENLSQITEYPSTSAPQIKEILDAIFVEGNKAPTIEELCNNAFFNVSIGQGYQRPEPVVFNKQIQQVLKKAHEATSQLFGVFKPAPKVKRTTKRLTTPGGAASPRGSIQAPSTPSSPTPAPAPAPVAKAPTPAPVVKAPTPTPPAPAATMAPPPVRTGGPPPPGPPPPSGGPPPPGPPPPAAATPGKSALLSSITNFKGGLKKVKTVDKSAPVAGKVL